MPSDPKRVQAVFLEAVAQPAGERGDVLRRECGTDEELRQRVEALLKAHDEPGSFLDVPEPPPEIAPTIDQPIAEQPGSVIGHYKLLQKLGEGGMGVVYMAEQAEPVKRRVALKIIKPGMDTAQVIARFEAERQALALMDHPGIAKVFDAGSTEKGRPYFVMELVKGIPLTDYCDEQHFTPQERLELFTQVCHAVQHAHQKGVIHRDIKPSNVLVAEYDHQAVPKIIDFGVAKATSQQLTERTMFTQYGQIVGTLEYMSPEQAKLNQLDIDTRSDIYSLGVLLYELLVGTTPFDRRRLRSAAFEEMLRIIREEEPLKPSLRLSTIDTLRSVAANRHIEPQKLSTLVRGDLDWIVMKALDKDRSRRYDTADGFAADIQHYLNDEPVVACPPSAGYRFHKFARRNKVVLAAASMITAAVIFGLIGTALQAIRATHAEIDAKAERDTANTQRALAIAAEKRARVEEARATKQRKNAKVLQLAGQAQAIREVLPVQSVLLAIEAVELGQHQDERIMAAAHEALLTTTANIGGLPLIGHEHRVVFVRISSDGRWLVTGGYDNTARLWDLAAGDPAAAPRVLRWPEYAFGSMAISPDGRWLVTGHEPYARLWDLNHHDPSASCKLLPGQKGSIGAAQITPDGRWLITGSDDGTARIWDLTADDPSASSIVLHGHERAIGPMTIGPNGRWIVTGSYDTTARLWDLTAKDPASSSRVLEHRDTVDSVAISPNGRWLVTGSSDGAARLWDLTAEDPTSSSRVLEGHQRTVSSIAITPDSRWVATGSWDGTARLWDTTSEDPSASSILLRGHEDRIWSIAISSDGRWLVSGSDDATARLWDLSAKDAASSCLVLEGHYDTVEAVAITPDCHRVVTGSWDGTARLWDLTSANPASPLCLRAHQGNISAVAISADDRWLVTHSADGTARVWERTQTAEDPFSLSRVLGGPDDPISSTAISPDGQWLITGGSDGTVRRWDLDDPTAAPRVFAGGKRTISAVATSPNNRWLVARDDGERARLWDLDDAVPTPQVLPRYQATGMMSPIVFSPDDRWLATATSQPPDGQEDIAAYLWDLTSDDPASSPIILPHGRETASLAFSPNGQWLVTASDNATARLWNLAAADPAASSIELRGHRSRWRIPAVAISADSRRLVTVNYDGSGQLWDLTATDPNSSAVLLDAHTGGLRSVAISPDGRWAITGSEDKTVRLWDLSARDPSSSSLVLRAHEASVTSIAVSRDSRWLITGSEDRTVRLWDLNTDSLIERARRLAGRELTPKERTQYMVEGP